MNGIIGRLQTEADLEGKRTDIQLETNIHAIKGESGEDIKAIVADMGVSISMSETPPTHSSLWIIPD